MRAMLLTAWALVAIAPSATAQGVSYGVKAGVAVATFEAEDAGGDSPFETLPGLVAGGFLTWPLAGRLALQPEALFSQKGASNDDGGGKHTQRIEYLDVPILASYRLVGASGRQVSAFAGPSFAVRLRARARSSFGGGTLEQDIGDDVARADTAIVFGVAYQRGRLVFDGRYNWGLTNIDKNAGDGGTLKNRSLSIMAGWAF